MPHSSNGLHVIVLRVFPAWIFSTARPRVAALSPLATQCTIASSSMPQVDVEAIDQGRPVREVPGHARLAPRHSPLPEFFKRIRSRIEGDKRIGEHRAAKDFAAAPVDPTDARKPVRNPDKLSRASGGLMKPPQLPELCQGAVR